MAAWIDKLMGNLPADAATTDAATENDRIVSVELSSAHDRLQRAKALADLAFADFGNMNIDRHGTKARAILRLADALRTYEELDAAAIEKCKP